MKIESNFVVNILEQVCFLTSDIIMPFKDYFKYRAQNPDLFI